MITNKSVVFFIVLFFCVAFVVSAQEGPRLSHRFSWTADEYAMRYQVVIEREEEGVYNTVLREFTNEAFIVFSLPVGNYRLQVTPYDFLDLPGPRTSWWYFRVVAGAGQRLEIQDAAASEIHTNIYLGIFAEVLGYTRDNVAYGGGITAGGSYNGMGFGLHFLYAQDTEGFVFFEVLGHFRWYFAQLKDNNGLFVQLEGGVVFYSYERFDTLDNILASIGLRAGWRIPLGEKWFIEPGIRGGFPYLIGAGFYAGIKF